ncbi:MAG: hypothetical protein JNM98_21595 [Rhodocyclaceae bacterium]|nr:hypothetical protein [Rhodocyclaceae bacterium]
MTLTGFLEKQDLDKASKDAAARAKAAEKTRADREYDLKRALENQALTDVAKDGKGACEAAQQSAQAEVERLGTPLADGASKEEIRQRKQQLAAATKKAKLYEALAALDDSGRSDAVDQAAADVASARKALDEATQNKDKLAKEAQAAAEKVAEYPNLDKAWQKNHAASQSARALEADLRKMQSDLSRLGNDAPPNAVQYCKKLEAKADHDAHHVNCPRCNSEHGIDRTPDAKAAVDREVKELERLAKLPDDSGLDEQQKRDRAMGKHLETLRANKGGKMIGVLMCEDADGNDVMLRAFSGDVDGQDDVAGWCQHIPPDGSGAVMHSANGVPVPLSALPAVSGAPHGVCAAPKLIQEAHRRGLKIVSIAEAWYGGGDVQPHGALVASCTTCRSNLDVQLCPAYSTI